MTIPAGKTGIESTDASVQLILDVPMIILSRYSQGGPDRAEADALDGYVITTEWPLTEDEPRFRVLIGRGNPGFLTATQRDVLEELLDLSLVNLKPSPISASYYLCTWAPRTEQQIVPYISEHPDGTRDGAAFANDRHPYWAELSFRIQQRLP